MKKISSGIIILMLVSVIGGAAWGAVPATMSFQGRIANADGPITTPVKLKFQIWATKGPMHAAMDPKWESSIRNITPDENGLFNVVLGDTTQDPTDLSGVPFDIPYFVDILIGSAQDFVDSQPLTSVPYALNAGAWTESGDNIYRETGNVGVGTPVTIYKLTVRDNVE